MLLVIGLGLPDSTPWADPVLREVLRSQAEALPGRPLPDGTPAARPRTLIEVYGRRDFEPAWPGSRLVELVAVLAGATDHGLRRRDYHYRALTELLYRLEREVDPPAELLAGADLLASDALALYLDHLRRGKVDPATLDASWHIARSDGAGLPARLAAALEGGPLAAHVEAALPPIPQYGRLRATLAEQRAIARAGGWPTVGPGPTLRPGDRDPRVVRLRERLRVAGSLGGEAASEPGLYDAGVEAAVREFQRRHGLEADGLTGPATLRALNRPVAERIDQLRVNLERTRWVGADAPQDLLVVNIAGFEARLLRRGEPRWRARVQVGRPYRRTPVFRSAIEHLVLNPSWTVPAGILRKDILPRVRRDPGYLGRMGMTLIDAAGAPVDPTTLDGEALGGTFPYTLRQAPGPLNALGRIKFYLPNPYQVYLHDTPEQGLFDRAHRGFSSGCIRVERPLGLAALLLAEGGRWDLPRLERAAATGRTRVVPLPRPETVMVLYWTVDHDEQGQARFFPDHYGRDAAVLAALDAPLPSGGRPSGRPTAGRP